MFITLLYIYNILEVLLTGVRIYNFSSGPNYDDWIINGRNSQPSNFTITPLQMGNICILIGNSIFIKSQHDEVFNYDVQCTLFVYVCNVCFYLLYAFNTAGHT